MYRLEGYDRVTKKTKRQKDMQESTKKKYTAKKLILNQAKLNESKNKIIKLKRVMDVLKKYVLFSFPF